MGDYGQSFARTDLDTAAAHNAAAEVRSWLIDEGVIVADLDDSVLGDLGHRPGPNWTTAAASNAIDEDRFLTLWANGVEIVGGRPGLVVYPNGGELDRTCAWCGSGFEDDSEFWEAVGEWHAWKEGAEVPQVSCLSCRKPSSVLDFLLGDSMALSLLEVTFNNWPVLSAGFKTEVLRRLGGNSRFVYGKR